MLMWGLIIFGVLLLLAAPFIFSGLSPIPYFPTSKKDLPLIIQAFKLQNNEVVFDLGAGDGAVIFKAAKEAYEEQLNTQFVAIEINPVLIFIMNWRKMFHPNKHNITIVQGDMFIYNFNKFIPNEETLVTFYLYISPWYMEKTVKNIRSLNRPFRAVTYFYPIPSLKDFEKKVEGQHKIYRYLVS